MPRSLVAGLLFVTLSTSVTWVQAHQPAEFLEVLKGQPSNLIEHAVDLKSDYDAWKLYSDLEGPHYVSIAVGCMGRKARRSAYLTWYRITNARPSERRQVDVTDLVRGADSRPLTIESAEYLLSPAQRITSGPPDDIPDGLDHYKAYRIVDAEPIQLDVTLSGAVGPANRRLGTPLFLCVAAEEWHHDELFPASHRRDGFVVYEMEDAVLDASSITLMDQFGLNRFSNESSRWLCVRALLPAKAPSTP